MKTQNEERLADASLEYALYAIVNYVAFSELSYAISDATALEYVPHMERPTDGVSVKAVRE